MASSYLALILLAVYATYHNQTWYALLKGLPVAYLIGYAYLHHSPVYLILALVFCLLGDLLLLSEKSVMLGLIAFALAHLFLVAYFLMRIDYILVRPQQAIPLLICVGIYAVLLTKRLDVIHSIGVIVYALIITSMLLSAWTVGNRDWTLGAYLFAFSDLILAYDLFVKRFFAARFIILITYYLGVYTITFG